MPVAFVHRQRDLVGLVHGDDFIWVGLDDELDWALNIIKNTYEVKN